MARKRTNLIGNTVLIETSWNVKPLNYEDIEALQTVLIETSWNVKSGILINPSGSVSVLIETSWNVKRVIPHCRQHSESINRNIVECKVLLFISLFCYG